MPLEIKREKEKKIGIHWQVIRVEVLSTRQDTQLDFYIASPFCPFHSAVVQACCVSTLHPADVWGFFFAQWMFQAASCAEILSRQPASFGEELFFLLAQESLCLYLKENCSRRPPDIFVLDSRQGVVFCLAQQNVNVKRGSAPLLSFFVFIESLIKWLKLTMISKEIKLNIIRFLSTIKTRSIKINRKMDKNTQLWKANFFF